MVGKHGQGGGLGVGIFDTIKEAAAVYQRRWCYNGIEGGGIGRVPAGGVTMARVGVT